MPLCFAAGYSVQERASLSTLPLLVLVLDKRISRRLHPRYQASQGRDGHAALVSESQEMVCSIKRGHVTHTCVGVPCTHPLERVGERSPQKSVHCGSCLRGQETGLRYGHTSLRYGVKNDAVCRERQPQVGRMGACSWGNALRREGVGVEMHARGGLQKHNVKSFKARESRKAVGAGAAEKCAVCGDEVTRC